MFSRIFKCVLFPRNNGINLSNNTIISNVIYKNDIKFLTIPKNLNRLSCLINKHEGVENLSLSKKLVSLKLIYSNLIYNCNNRNINLICNEQNLDYHYSVLNDILASLSNITRTDGRIKESLTHVLINIANISNNVEINNKISNYVQSLVLSSNDNDTVKLLKIFIKTNYNKGINQLLNKLNIATNFDSDSLFDLHWCLTTLGVEFKSLNSLLEKIVARVEIATIVNNLKLLNSLHSTFCKINTHNVQNNLILSNNTHSFDESTLVENRQSLLDKISSYCNNDNADQLTKVNQKELLDHTIRYIKSVLLDKINEFDNSRALCNFIYYITSTINDFTLSDYKQLAERMTLIINDRRDIAPEGLIQLMWSFQKNNVSPAALLKILVSEFNRMLECSIGMRNCVKGFKRLSIGQISLFLYSQTYFNLMDLDISSKALRYLKDYNNRPKTSQMAEDVLKQINIIWAICISHFNKLEQIHKDIVACLNNIEWNSFVSKSEFEDLRKVMQIVTVLKLEGGCNDLKIPENVLKMVNISGNTSVDYKINSVTQDKVRRVLQSKGINFKSEYEVNSQITVDFLLFPQNISNAFSQGQSNTDNINSYTRYDSHTFSNGLVIEIDGPYHYNLLLDPESEVAYDRDDQISFGSVKLILNGKTVYRNKILKRLGYNIVSIPWFVGYQKSFYEIIETVLNTHRHN